MPDNNIEWGQGSVNNSNDWGGAKANSTNNFGAVYDSSPSGDTNIVGGTTLSITYSASAYCDGIGDTPQPTIAGNTGAGTFSSTSGIIFADSGSNTGSSTGVIDVDASTDGATYVVTYTDTDSDIATANVTLNALDNAGFNYSASSYTQADSDPTPTITGLTGGTFSGTTGLVFVDSGTNTGSSTGEIDLSASTIASYTVTYSTSSSGSSVCPNTSTFGLAVTAAYSPLQLQFSVTSGVEKTISVGITGTNYTIDWGDGTIETNQTGGTKSHIYNVGGSGTTSNPTISIGASADTGPVANFTIPVRTDLLDIFAWGSLVYSGTWASKFRNCTNLASQITATDAPNIASVGAFADLFRNTPFNSNINHWDVGSNTNIANMFKASTSFNQSLNSWNTSNVTNMAGIFQQASSFNGDISNWDTSSVTSFSVLFYFTSNFNKDVSSWDVSSCTNFTLMFSRASNFSKNLAGWYVNGLNAGITSMSSMFSQTSMTSAQFTDTIVGWAVAVRRDSAPYNISAATTSPSSFDATRTQDTDNSGNSVDYSTKYGSDWDSNWDDAGDARQFLLDNGWSVS